MLPDLDKAKKYKNVQIGKDIFLPDLYILPNGQAVYTTQKPLTPQMEQFVNEYMKAEWFDLGTPPDQDKQAA